MIKTLQFSPKNSSKTGIIQSLDTKVAKSSGSNLIFKIKLTLSCHET
jgi:hypothetical protein